MIAAIGRVLAVGVLALFITFAIAFGVSFLLGHPKGLPAYVIGAFIGLTVTRSILAIFSNWIAGESNP